MEGQSILDELGELLGVLGELLGGIPTGKPVTIFFFKGFKVHL